MDSPMTGPDAVEYVMGVIRKTVTQMNMSLDPQCAISFHSEKNPKTGLNNDESFDACLKDPTHWPNAVDRLTNAATQHGLIAGSIQRLQEANANPAMISFDAFKQAGVIVRTNCLLKCDGTNVYARMHLNQKEEATKGQWCTWP